MLTHQFDADVIACCMTTCCYMASGLGRCTVACCRKEGVGHWGHGGEGGEAGGKLMSANTKCTKLVVAQRDDYRL